MITLLAATGFTGRLIAAQLQRLGASFQIAGRSMAKLRSLKDELGLAESKCLEVDVQDSAALQRALRTTSVLINCAGPFTDLGLPVVAAAMRHSVHYLDTTGEQDFIRRVYELHAATARSLRRALMPACAFEYAIGDALGKLCAENFESLEFYYQVEGLGASRGTKKSVIRAVTSPFHNYQDGTHRRCEGFELRRLNGLSFLEFGGGEVYSLPLHTEVRSIRTFINLGNMPGWLLRLMVLAAGLMLKTSVSHLVFRWIDAQPAGPDVYARDASRFRIVCKADSLKAKVSGSDPYGLTALIAATTAVHLAKTAECVAFSPADLLGADFVRELTAQVGCVWHIG